MWVFLTSAQHGLVRIFHSYPLILLFVAKTNLRDWSVEKIICWKKQEILETKAAPSFQAAYLHHAMANQSPAFLQHSKTICESQFNRNVQAKVLQLSLLFIFSVLPITLLWVTTIVQLAWKQLSSCRNLISPFGADVGFSHYKPNFIFSFFAL